MPRGFACLYSRAPREQLFHCINSYFRNNDISLEHPTTKLVHIWDNDGNLLQINKDDVLGRVLDIENDLIQYWWEETEDIAVKFITYKNSNNVMIHLDGLDNTQVNQIASILTSIIYTDNMKSFVLGFVIDRQQFIEESIWSTLFIENSHSINNLVDDQYSIKQITDETTCVLDDYEIMISIHDFDKDEFLFYIISML